MAYHKGQNRNKQKRMADLGHAPVCDDLRLLWEKMLVATTRFAHDAYPAHVLDDEITDLDRVMLRTQAGMAADGSLNSVWAEKARIIAKVACEEQAARRARTLYGRFKNMGGVGDRPLPDGTRRLTSFPEEFSRTLTDADVAALAARAADATFADMIPLLRAVRAGDDCGFSPLQAEALRAMIGAVQERFPRPEWREDAIVQIHLDSRGIKNTKRALRAALDALRAGLRSGAPAAIAFKIASHTPRASGIPVSGRLPVRLAARGLEDGDDVDVVSLVLELGPERVHTKAVLARPVRKSDLSGAFTVLAEDFGLTNTSSMCVMRCDTVVEDAVLAFLRTDPDKGAMRTFLSDHARDAGVEVLERVQFSGKRFLDRVQAQCGRIDTIRSEIDRSYARLQRLRAEIRVLAPEMGPEDLVPEIAPARPDLSDSESARWVRMHRNVHAARASIDTLKALRRRIYAEIAGLKRSWFGFLGRVRAALAARHGAVIVAEKLTFVTAERKSSDYKGKAFNRMINDGSRGQHARRVDNTAKWAGIPVLRIPSFYTSTTDARFGVVDAAQRCGPVFTAKADGRVTDADLHAAETIGRILFLRPKNKDSAPASAAAA